MIDANDPYRLRELVGPDLAVGRAAAEDIAQEPRLAAAIIEFLSGALRGAAISMVIMDGGNETDAVRLINAFIDEAHRRAGWPTAN